MSRPPDLDVPAYIEPGFGERLKNARLRAGFISQPKLARVMECSVMTISRHETETCIPTRDMIAKYCDALNVSEGYIVLGRNRGYNDLPRAVYAYLRGEQSSHLLEETKRRLRRIQWDLLAAGEVDEKDVYSLASLIDTNLRSRGISPHGPHEGAISLSGDRRPVPSEPAREASRPGRGRPPANARA